MMKKKKTALSGSSGGPDLPDDIIFNILLRLPAKSLIRFKTLSKCWNALITSPSFIRQHHLQQPSSKILMTENFVYEKGGSYKCMDPMLLTFNDKTLRCHPNVYKPFKIKQPYILHKITWVMGPCFGVFCFGMYSQTDRIFTITLCNITNGETKVVPHLNTLDRGDFSDINAYGFGCVVDNNSLPEFKVVRLPSIWNRSGLCHVYSSATNIWKSIELPCQSCFPDAEGTEVNGVIYWLAKALGNIRFTKYILTFDLAKEVFGGTEIPNCGTKKSPLFLTNIKQDDDHYLSLIAGPDSPLDHIYTDLWVMRVGESWVSQTICDGKSLVRQQIKQWSAFVKVLWLGYWHSVGGMLWRVYGTIPEWGISLVIGDKPHDHECRLKLFNMMLFDYVESIVSFNLE